jgi:hypothetical protein
MTAKTGDRPTCKVASPIAAEAAFVDQLQLSDLPEDENSDSETAVSQGQLLASNFIGVVRTPR